MPFFMKDNKRVPKTKKSDIPSDFQGFYKEDGDDLVLNDELMPTINLIDGLNNANSRLRTEVDDWKKKAVDLSDLTEFGNDPKSIKTEFDKRLTELKTQLESGSKSNIDFEKAKRDLIEERDRAVKAAEDKNKETTRRMHSYVKSDAVKAALMGENGNYDLLGDKLMNMIEVVEDGDSFRTVVKGENGKHRVSSTNGELLSVYDLVKEMKSDDRFAIAFKSEAPSGGPTNPTGTTTGNPTGSNQRDNKNQASSPVQKIAIGLAQRKM